MSEIKTESMRKRVEILRTVLKIMPVVTILTVILVISMAIHFKLDGNLLINLILVVGFETFAVYEVGDWVNGYFKEVGD